MNITSELIESVRKYIEIVDSGDESRQGDERTSAHEELMDIFEKSKIPFNSRFEARWIARWILKTDSLPSMELPDTKIMFAKQNEYNGTAVELRDIPPDDNKEGWMPVMVFLLPFEFQPYKADRSE